MPHDELPAARLVHYNDDRLRESRATGTGRYDFRYYKYPLSSGHVKTVTGSVYFFSIDVCHDENNNFILVIVVKMITDLSSI